MEKISRQIETKIKVAVLLFSFLFTGSAGWAQFTYSICQDKPNNGQLKRMVYIKWDDWKPNPRTILGIPLDARGYLFWQVVNRNYYLGEDQRPYRVNGGPFIKNYADLTLQEQSDKKIMDTTEKIRNTNLATYVSMLGGNGDMPYNLFFKRKFSEIFDAMDEWVNNMKIEAPTAFEACINSAYFRNFLEYLEITKDRIDGVHESFVDRGVRLEAYLEIYKELSEKYNVASQYMAGQVRLSKIPSPARLKEIKEVPIIANDKKIVTHILSTFKF